MTKTRISHPPREKAADQSHDATPHGGGQDDEQARRAGKGYVPVRSYQIPADRHE